MHSKEETRCLLMIFLYSWQLRTITVGGFTKYVPAMWASQTQIQLKKKKMMLAWQSYWILTDITMGTARCGPWLFSPWIQRFMCGRVREFFLWSLISSSISSHLLWEPGRGGGPEACLLYCSCEEFGGPPELSRPVLCNGAATSHLWLSIFKIRQIKSTVLSLTSHFSHAR